MPGSPEPERCPICRTADFLKEFELHRAGHLRGCWRPTSASQYGRRTVNRRSRCAERSLSNEDFLEFKSQAVEFGSAMLENVLDKLSDEHGSDPPAEALFCRPSSR